MDVEGELVFPPPTNGRVNIIFPSSSADKLSFQSGLVAFSQGLTGRVGLDAAVVSIDNKVVGKEFLSETSDYYPLKTEHTFLAGTDKERLENLVLAFSQENTSSIICERGGYGASRLFPLLTDEVLDQLVPLLRKHRFVGFSDATFLHNMFRIAHSKRFPGSHLVTVHGPMPMAGTLFSAPQREDDRRRTFAVLCDEFSTETFPPIQSDILCHGGVVKGRLVGGNLTCLLACEGTEWAVERDEDIILVLEDVNERPYRLDRMMGQLKNAGILKACVGLVLGEFGDSKESHEQVFSEFDSEAYFWKVVVGLESLGIPVLYHAPVGHGDVNNYPLALGAVYQLDCTNGQRGGMLGIAKVAHNI